LVVLLGLAELLKNTVLINEDFVVFEDFGVEGAETVHLATPELKGGLDAEVEAEDRPADLQVDGVLAVVHEEVALHEDQRAVLGGVVLEVEVAVAVGDVGVVARDGDLGDAHVDVEAAAHGEFVLGVELEDVQACVKIGPFLQFSLPMTSRMM